MSWAKVLSRARGAAGDAFGNLRAGIRDDIESARQDPLVQQVGKAWRQLGRVHPSQMVHPAVPIESWFASYKPKELDDNLESYLLSVEREHREAERAELLRLMRGVQPARRPRRGLAIRYVERRKRVDFDTPLFEFSAPEIDGAMVRVQTSVALSTSTKWQFILGTGGIGSKLIAETQVFPAFAGEHKEIYVPSQAEVVRRFRAYGGSRALFAALTPNGFDEIRPLPNLVEAPTVRSFNRVPFGLFNTDLSIAGSVLGLRRPSSGQTVRRYRLAGNRSGNVEVEWFTEDTREYSMGPGGTAFGMSVNAGVSVKLTNSLRIFSSLPPGHNYDLQLLDDRPGISWRVS